MIKNIIIKFWSQRFPTTYNSVCQQILESNEIVGCVTVEPYMLGDFVKLTNNTSKKESKFKATDYGLAFGHFTYLLSGGQEVVVDLQGVSLSIHLQSSECQQWIVKARSVFLLLYWVTLFNFSVGWVTANGKGMTYLTDPQIHSTITPRGPSNFAGRGLRLFVEEQHGPQCNAICHLLRLPPFCKETHFEPQ